MCHRSFLKESLTAAASQSVQKTQNQPCHYTHAGKSDLLYNYMIRSDDTGVIYVFTVKFEKWQPQYKYDETRALDSS